MNNVALQAGGVCFEGEGDMIENRKIFIWILIPFVYGLLSNIFAILLHPFLSQLIFTVFWFWVGMKISRLSGNKVKLFFIGNSIWLISFLLYLWQFVLLDNESRNMFFALISQYYMFSFIWSGSNLTSLFTDVIHGTTITIISYLVMLLVFTVGFIVGKVVRYE